MTAAMQRTSSRQPDESDWKDLLFRIERGDVVPILGRDLLVLDAQDGTTRFFYREVAVELAAVLKVPSEELPAEPSVEDVASRFLDQRDAQRDTLYAELRDLLDRKTQELNAVPRPLEKLARIEPLKVFVSTTFDNLLVQTLRTYGSARVTEYAYTPYASSEDLPPQQGKSDDVAVYCLLGRAGGAGEYAVTEEDTLELVHGLQTKLELAQGELKRLGALLQKKQLLFLGCAFPDWLMRFFIRTLRGERFSVERERRRMRVAGRRMEQEGSLEAFLRQCGARVYAEDATDFIAELERRWAERRSPPKPTGAPAPANGAPRVLLACAAKDQEKVTPVATRLMQWGIKSAIVDLYESGNSVKGLLDACAAYVVFPSQSALAETLDPRLLKAWSLVDQWHRADEKRRSIVVLSLDKDAHVRYARLRDQLRADLRLLCPSPNEEVALRITDMLLEKRQLDVPLPLRLYCAWADKDEEHRKAFEGHLGQRSWLKIWQREAVSPGDNAAAVCEAEMARANVIVPLLSVDLLNTMAPEGQPEAEYDRILELNRLRKAFVVGIVLRACNWEQGGLDALPVTSEPIYSGKSAAEVDAAWKEVVQALLIRICDHALRPRADEDRSAP